MSVRSLLTVSQFSTQHPAFPEGGLRWQIFNEDSNGLRESGAIVRVGRKVTIDVDLYFRWIDSQQKSVSPGRTKSA